MLGARILHQIGQHSRPLTSLSPSRPYLHLIHPTRPYHFAFIHMQRRNSHNSNEKEPLYTDAHEPEHTEQDHSHSHSVFHSHSHSPGDSTLVSQLEAKDRGSRITLIGLFSNVGLTVTKAIAGWSFHSASLLADAGHSASDLMGDIVTLTAYKFGRRPPSERYPYGFAKYETIGSATISILLVGGALGLGFHSYSILLEAMTVTATTAVDGSFVQTAATNVTSVLPQIPSSLGGHHDHHGHSHGLDALNPNAAWFALLGVVVKEWLFRATRKVAKEESSSVLMANAWHHKSDAYSSMVAFVAILGSWWYPSLPLDPIGGLLVSVIILRQGLGLLRGAVAELTDAGIPSQTYTRLLKPLANSELLGFSDVRARRAGSKVFIDMSVEVPSSLTIVQSTTLEEKIETTLKTARKEISEVRVKFVPSSTENI